MPPLPFRPRRLALALAAFALPAAPALADGAAPLKEVVVTATRSQQATDLIPGTVTTVDRDDLDRRGTRTIADALADEPDVAMPADARRFGSGNINIRGIEDNRVLMLIDGVRSADFRSPGTTNYDASNRDVPDPDFLKRIEIVRGPGSSLYGSDALGGVVGFLTLDPDDLLKGRPYAVGGKATYFSADRSTSQLGYGAIDGGDLKGLLMVSHRSGHEIENKSDSPDKPYLNGSGLLRSSANPQDYDTTDILAKLAYRLNANHRFKLTLENRDTEVKTDVRRVSNVSPGSPNNLSRITRNLGDDSIARNRVSLDYDWLPTNTALFDRLGLKLYTQTQETTNRNKVWRTNTSASCSASTPGAANCLLDQRFDFEQTRSGASLVMEKEATWLTPQSITWGADWMRARTAEKKDATWTNLATGVQNKTLLGDSYPSTDYPKGHADSLGLFAQDELRFLDNRLRLTPGIRYDHYSLTPESDPLYVTKPGYRAVDKSGSKVSSKFAASFEVMQGWNVYGQYAEGFRPPNYQEVNRFFYNGSQNYGSVGNPNLEPETSKSVELGLKVAGATAGGQVAVFHNRYRNFIDNIKISASNPAYIPGSAATYQYQNLSQVTIRGFELRGYWQPLKELRLNGAFAYASGTDQDTDRPINSIEPRRLTLSAQWTPTATVGLEARFRAAWRKDRVDDSSAGTGQAYFRTPGYGVTDLSAYWQFHKTARINVAVNNLFDKKYWLWNDVRRSGLLASDQAPEFYTQPRRNAMVSLALDF